MSVRAGLRALASGNADGLTLGHAYIIWYVLHEALHIRVAGCRTLAFGNAGQGPGSVAAALVWEGHLTQQEVELDMFLLESCMDFLLLFLG